MNRLYAWLNRLFAPKGFPRKVKGYTYCIEWYLYTVNLTSMPVHPPKNRFIFRHIYADVLDISENKKDQDPSRKFPGIYPCINLEGKVGYYRVIGEPYLLRGTSISDLAYWDDGKSIDLELVFVK